MNVLMLSQTLNLDERGVYTDTLKELIKKGHKVTVVKGNSNINTNYQHIKNKINVYEIKIKNQFGINVIRKGIVLLTFERRFIKEIKKNLKYQSYDMILYNTPPVTFAKVIKYCKNKYNAKTYLMLKDIFPQNSIDLGMLRKSGIRGLIYKFFRKREILLYKQSDRIGCMSPANINYILKNNNFVSSNKLELFPNAIYPIKMSETNIIENDNLNMTYFFFGGNLGMPQNISNLLNYIERIEYYEKAHFTIIGKGTEQKKVVEAANRLKNLTFYDFLSKEDYTKILEKADVGIISLDPRFTIPNYPSRILSYMELQKPIFGLTDCVTDIKELITLEAKCGLWNQADDFDSFYNNVKWFCENAEERVKMGKRGREYMLKHFNVEENVKKLERFILED